MEKQLLGQILVANGILNHEQLDIALSKQREEGGLLGMILLSLNYISNDDLIFYLKMQNK